MGTIDNDARERVENVGKWLEKNGEGIYNTVNARNYNDGKIWFTRNKDRNTLYAFYALDDDDALPSTIEWTGNIPEGNKVKLLGDGRSLKCTVKDGKVSVKLPGNIDRGTSLGLSFKAKAEK